MFKILQAQNKLNKLTFIDSQIKRGTEILLGVAVNASTPRLELSGLTPVSTQHIDDVVLSILI